MIASSPSPVTGLRITEALVLEHRIFDVIFQQIERALPGLTTLAEVRTLAAMMEGLLESHGEAETDLAYLAFDHVMHDQGRLEQLHAEHQEIDSSLRRIRAADTPDEARRLLGEALRATRAHMEFEEHTVFPLLEHALQPATLVELGNLWAQRLAAAPV